MLGARARPSAALSALESAPRRRTSPRARRADGVGVLAALTALATAVAPAEAGAEPRVLVLLLRPIPANAALGEAILRIRSELAAGGFDVTVTDIAAKELAADPRALMERAEQGLAPSATLGIVGDAEAGPTELWVVDRITGKTVVRRLAVEATADHRISEVLAIRAQELLRASLVELLLQQSRPRVQAPPPEVRRWVEQAMAPPRPAWRFALELGATAFGGAGGIGPALAPAVRVRLAVAEGWWLRLTAIGLGTRPTVHSDLGEARVSQSLALLEGAAKFRAGRRIQPVLTVGAGAERVGVEGRNVLAPFRGEHNARWFAAGDLGAGVSLRVHPHWELLCEAHALFAAPRPMVRFFDVEAARAGRPTFFVILTLAGGA